jgi:hypothetical protein
MVDQDFVNQKCEKLFQILHTNRRMKESLSNDELASDDITNPDYVGYDPEPVTEDDDLRF